MAAAFIPVLPGLDNIVKWGIELTQFQYVVLMKRPKESATGSGLLAPFEIEVKYFHYFFSYLSSVDDFVSVIQFLILIVFFFSFLNTSYNNYVFVLR